MEQVEARGTLVRDAGGFVLRRDGGAVELLELARVPVDLVEKRVVVRGERMADGRIAADGVAPA